MSRASDTCVQGSTATPGENTGLMSAMASPATASVVLCLLLTTYGYPCRSSVHPFQQIIQRRPLAHQIRLSCEDGDGSKGLLFSIAGHYAPDPAEEDCAKIPDFRGAQMETLHHYYQIARRASSIGESTCSDKAINRSNHHDQSLRCAEISSRSTPSRMRCGSRGMATET